ncbi:zinc-ribbon domain-containing protein [Paenibacillus xylanilyticus]|uniref:zinc-ribbon domain-containing protein n=1 Tax=Paenibacillus xylanilyticus TaxID=248903 RepID=UPI003AAB6D19
MILEHEVEVTLNPQTAARYRDMGYDLPSNNTVLFTRKSKLFVRVGDLPTGSTVKVTKICDTCGSSAGKQTYQNVIRSRKEGKDYCASCSRSRLGSERALKRALAGESFGDVHKDLIGLWNFNLNKGVTPFQVTYGSGRRVWWKCDDSSCGHEWMAQVAAIAKGTRCPICSTSKGERSVSASLKRHCVKFIHQAKADGLVGVGGSSLLFDFVVLDHNDTWVLVIEYDGQFHSYPIDKDGRGKDHAIRSFKRQKEHDKRKDEWAENKGIELLRISYKEIDKIEDKISDALVRVLQNREVLNDAGEEAA